MKEKKMNNNQSLYLLWATILNQSQSAETVLENTFELFKRLNLLSDFDKEYKTLDYEKIEKNMEQTKEHKERNKGGRPKKEATEKLKYRIAVKMTAADYFRLLTRSHEAGVSPSEYMRECFRNGHVKERLSEEHAGYIRQLCGMANNLNQLARKANAGGFHDERWDCKVAVARIHELITKIGI